VPAPGPYVAPPPIKLKKEQLELRTKLLELLEEARGHMNDKMRDATTRDLAHLQDVSDVAADASEGDLALRLAENVRVEAGEIERAIQKIDNGTYGLCESCDIPIPEERMHFLPFATHCIKCQELQDIRRKRRSESSQNFDGEEDLFPDEIG
jgi:DnaK suppressor protein